MLLTDQSLESLIQVKSPYYCLFDILPINEKCLTAKANNEYLDPNELGPVGGGEAGRHLAICGSLQLARSYNYGESAYFLAVGATIKRQNLEVIASEYYQLEVCEKSLGKRTATVEGTIFNTHGEAIFVVEIHYQVVRNSIFSKLFAGNKKEISAIDYNPYVDRKRLKNIRIEGSDARATYGVVQPEDCSGHFQNYPALPVAIIANLYAELGFALFHSLTKNSFNKIALIESNISAERLAFSGEKVDFELTVTEIRSKDTIAFHGNVLSNDQLISKASFVFQGV